MPNQLRTFTPQVDGVLAAGTYEPRVMVWIEFEAGTWTAWTGKRPVDWVPPGETGPVTWTELGPLLAVGQSALVAEGGSRSVEVVMTGLDPQAIVWARSGIFGKVLKVFRCFVDSEGDLIPDPFEVFSGLMDYCVITRASDNSVAVTFSAETPDILFSKSSPRLRTHQDQKDTYPTDNFFKNVAKLPDMPLISPGPNYAPPRD